MQLMNGDTPVLNVNVDLNSYEVLNESLLPYELRGSFKVCPEDASSKVRDKIRDYNREIFTLFLARRMISLDRTNAKKLLNAYNFSQSQDVYTKARIAIACRAVSMTDNFWLKPRNKDLKWNDLNPRKNSLNKIVTSIALTGSSLTLTGQPHTPELTGQGAYAKAWVRENNITYLYKADSKYGIESDVEVSVSNILNCFNVPHVVYEKTTFDNKVVCRCANMSTEDLSIIPAEDVWCYCNRHDLNFMEFVLGIDSENFYKTCIVDYLISNSDRHMKNWGFFQDNKTGELLACHPLFDHNNAFDEGDMEVADGGKSLMITDSSKREAAKYALKHCSFQCTKVLENKYFISPVAYDSFMKRAVELNLYKTNIPTFLQKIGLKSFNQYEPLHINPNATIKMPVKYETFLNKEKLTINNITSF